MGGKELSASQQSEKPEVRMESKLYSESLTAGSGPLSQAADSLLATYGFRLGRRNRGEHNA